MMSVWSFMRLVYWEAPAPPAGNDGNDRQLISLHDNLADFVVLGLRDHFGKGQVVARAEGRIKV